MAFRESICAPEVSMSLDLKTEVSVILDTFNVLMQIPLLAPSQSGFIFFTQKYSFFFFLLKTISSHLVDMLSGLPLFQTGTNLRSIFPGLSLNRDHCHSGAG